ncbi:hypothetical protein [Mangrovicoccus sp. HB161399]|uniref:hypothetical protein n=1 Tax=Mangrovicoccus sp. HB161399 TaxID=2720392 RepID=UPI0015525DFE|nr:hypothetical protein [Mangrovicoccus sp. HB161399]
MTAHSKAAKRRAKKANPLGLPELSESRRREKDGHFHRATEDRLPDAERETIKTRCRHAGKEITMTNIREMRAPWHGCVAGRAMAAHSRSEQEKQDLWSAICHMRRTQAAFDRAIGAPNRHPKCMKVEFLPSELSADADTPPVDERSDEERVQDATSAMMQVEGWLGHTDSRAACEGKRVVIQDEPVRDWVGLMSALRCVSDGLCGRRMHYRGR